MATLIYLPSSGAAPVTPSTWIFPNQINPVTYKSSTTKASTTMTTKAEATGTTSPTQRAMARWVIGPLQAQTISGTVRAVIRCQESATGANAHLAIAIKIIQSTGSDRATLLGVTSADSATSPYEMTTTLSSRRAWTSAETEPLTITSQSASAGDYLVVEMGFRSATTTSRTVSLRLGDAAASDLTYSDGVTSDYNGWVEFSQTIDFQLPAITGNLTSALAGLELSGSASLALISSLDGVLSMLELSGGADLEIQSQMAGQLDDSILAASGVLSEPSISGSLSVELDSLGLTGSSQLDIKAGVETALSAVTIGSSAGLAIGGSAEVDLSGLVAESQSGVLISSALAGVLADNQLSSISELRIGAITDYELEGLGITSSGALQSAITADLTVSFADIELSSDGNLWSPIAGVLESALDDMQTESETALGLEGALSVTLVALGLSSQAKIKNKLNGRHTGPAVVAYTTTCVKIGRR